MDGRIIAPTNPTVWGSGLLQWLEFKNLNGISVKGKGTIDGQGSVWWQNAQLENPDYHPNYTTRFALVITYLLLN